MQYIAAAITATSVPAAASSSWVINLLNSPLSVSLLDSLVGLVLAASIAAYISLKQLEYQKVRDGIEKRYFENGLEKLISYLNLIRLEAEENYARAVSVVQHARDLDKEDFKKWFLSIKPTDTKQLMVGMPDSLVTTSAFIKDKLFQYLTIRISLTTLAASNFFTTEFFRLIGNELEEGGELFGLKEKIGRAAWIDLMNKGKDELTRRHNRTAPVYKLVGVLEVILMRLRSLNVHSYKKFVETSQTDKEILQRYGDIRNILLEDIKDSYATILEYITILKPKKVRPISVFEAGELMNLKADVGKIDSGVTLSDDEIIASEQRMDEAINHLRWIMGGVMVP